MGEMIMMVGLPGSGKSTWLKAHQSSLGPGISDVVRLSLDDYRRLMTGREYHAPFEPIAISWIESTGRYFMSQGVSIVLDTTSIKRGLREKWCRIAKEYGFKTRAIVMDTQTEVSWTRNETRERHVPRDAFDRMVREFEAPSKDEGWDVVEFVK